MQQIKDIKKLCEIYDFEFESIELNEKEVKIDVVIDKFSKASLFVVTKRVTIGTERTDLEKIEFVDSAEYKKFSCFYMSALPMLEKVRKELKKC